MEDGYTWLACVRCGPEDYGTALVCLDDAHPLPELVEAMAAHVCEGVEPARVVESPSPRGREVYVRVSDAFVDRSECLGMPGTVDYDVHGNVVGVEIVGALAVEVDGVAAW